jgi:hypothetical protein
MKFSLGAPLILVAFLAACAPGPAPDMNSEPEIGISHRVLEGYNHYLASHTPEAFAVSEGGGTYYYFYCEAARCSGSNLNSREAIDRAIAGCNDQEQGPCLLFAVGRSPPRKYHLID